MTEDGRPILPRAFTAHPVAALGAALTTLSAVLFVLLFVVESLGMLENPYLGLLTFVLLPALFVLGLLLIPVGVWLARRRARQGKAPFAAGRRSICATPASAAGCCSWPSPRSSTRCS